MYDYISITDSKESTTIVFAYGKLKGNICMETFVHEKPYNAFVRTQMSIYGMKEASAITESEFYYKLGFAVGEITNAVPNERSTNHEH